MLLNGEPVFIDWGEVCSDIASNTSPEVTAIDVFMRIWFKPATGYKIRNEEKILEKFQELKEYVLNEHRFNIEDETKYETELKEKIQMKQKEQEDQEARLQAKLAKLARLSKKKSKGGATKRSRQSKRRRKTRKV